MGEVINTPLKPRIIALLPMKKNSQRVPGKNFKEFCGKPLFQWVLDTLLSIEQIDQVIINTDARETLAQFSIVENEKLTIRDRAFELCGDSVSMNLVLADDIQAVPADIYLMTHTTNPFITKATILGALEKFQQESARAGVDSLFTVDKIQTRFYRSGALPVNHDPDNLIPTQDLEPWFEENSNLYIFTKESFEKTSARIGMNPIMFESPRFESIDIDTPEDWEFAVVAANYLQAINIKEVVQ